MEIGLIDFSFPLADDVHEWHEAKMNHLSRKYEKKKDVMVMLMMLVNGISDCS